MIFPYQKNKQKEQAITLTRNTNYVRGGVGTCPVDHMVQLLLSMVEEDGGTWNSELGDRFLHQVGRTSVTGEGMSKTLKRGSSSGGTSAPGVGGGSYILSLNSEWRVYGDDA